jgi:sugar O-acyltransferase (sialic acid O-acetyltransferase NeuD family)
MKLAILGASGHGVVVADLAEQLGFNVNFFDDNYPEETELVHWPISGTFTDLLKLDNREYTVAVAIGNNLIRSQKTKIIQDSGFTLPVLQHPKAYVSKYAVCAAGTVIFANAVINPFANIGQGCIVNSAAVIEHDCVVNDFCHISPNATLAGGVKIGINSWIGLGSQVKQLIKIGNNAIVGAGSIVVKDIPSDVTVYGSPAEVVKKI